MIFGKFFIGFLIKYSGYFFILEVEMIGRCLVLGIVWIDLFIKWIEWVGFRSEDVGFRFILDLSEFEFKLIRDLDFLVFILG